MGIVKALKIRLVHTIFILLAVVNLYGQDRTLTLLNKSDNSPVDGAYVIITAINNNSTDQTMAVVSDKNGIVNIPVNIEVAIYISHLGFAEKKDTLPENESGIYYLNPLSFSLDQVVVTAQYSPDDSRNSVHQVKVIKRKTIEQKGANNLRELLSQETNIRLSQDNILGSSLSMQGLSGEQIKIMVNGVPVIGRVNGNIDISQVNLNNAEKVEIIEGPVSVQYGSNALGGVVNIITEKDQKEDLKVDLNGYYESVGVYNLDGGVGFRKKDHEIDLSGGRYFFGGYSENDTSRHKDWKPKLQYFGGVSYALHKKLDVILSGDFFSEKVINRGQPRRPYYVNAFDEYYKTKRYNGSAVIKGKILENHYLNQVFAYSFYSRTKNTYYKDLVTLSETMTPNVEDQDTSKFDSFLARGFVSRNKQEKIFNYQLGYDINIERGRGKRIEDYKQFLGDYAIFGSFNIKPVQMLAIQAGIRWSYNSIYKAPITPSLNIKWRPVDDFILRLSYARGFRTPSLKELYFYFVDINHNIQGNQDLKAENSHNLTLYLDYSKSVERHDFQILPMFFFNDINNHIALAELENVEYTYINVDDYQTLGGQVEFKYGFSDNLFIKIGGGATGRKNSIASDKFSFSPEASFEAGYTIPKAKILVSVYNKFNGAINGFSLNESGEITEQSIEAYNLLDLTFNRMLWKQRLSLTIGAKNLLDVNNIKTSGGGGGVHSGTSDTSPIAWGRTFFASLKFSFAK